MQLSAVLSHPDQPHFPHPPPPHSPPHPPPPSFPPAPKKKSRSQLRRQERRKNKTSNKSQRAASKESASGNLDDGMASETAASSSAETEKDLPEYIDEGAEDANNSDKEDTTKCTETAAREAAGKTALSGIQFKCDQCDYESASDKGVKQHTRMKHRISQLDGQDDCEVNSSGTEKNLCPLCIECSYCVDYTCEECEFLSSKEGLSCHVMNDHEPQDVLKHFGLVWINANMKNINRNLDCAQDRYHLQKWESFISCK